MNINEAGVLPESKRYIFTPSSFAERIFYYPTRIGHYFCDRRYCFSHRNKIAVQPAHLSNYMIFFVKNGQMKFMADEVQKTVSRNQIVVFDCQKMYEYQALTDDLEFYWLLFNGGQSALLYQQILQTYGSHVFETGAYAQIEILFNHLLSIGDSTQRFSERIYSEKIYALLCRMLVSENDQDDSFAETVDKAITFMDANLERMLSVNTVASHVGLSASYFSKRFRVYMGYSPYEYLTLQRIHRAKELLISTNLTVQQIGFEVGYNSEDNFIKSFKKKVGISPNNFRKYPI